MFFKPRNRLTKMCERISLETIGKTAYAPAAEIRASYAKDTEKLSPTDRHWSLRMAAEDHVKRGTVLHLIVCFAAAELWRCLLENKLGDAWPLPTSKKPFKNANSDVVIAEALIFFCFSFFGFISKQKRLRKLGDADLRALTIASTASGHIIQELTGWEIADLIGRRFDEYNNAERGWIEEFVGVIVRCMGKKQLSDPDCDMSIFGSLDYTPIIMATTVHVTAMVSSYHEIYANIIAAYPMD